MKSLKSIIHNKEAKTKIPAWALIALLLVGILFITGTLVYDPQSGTITPGTPSTPGVTVSYPDQPTSSNLVDVTKPVDFYLLDKYPGSSLGTYVLTVYEEDTETGLLRQVESLTTASDGTIATSGAYGSGKELWVKMSHGSASEKMWFTLTVPQMSPANAESLSVNGPITLYGFDYTAPTITVYDSSNNLYADNGDFNKTSGGTPGSSTETLRVTYSQGTDNDGYIASYDYLNDQQWQAWLIVKLSGTNYELVSITGFPYGIEKGSAMYYGKIIDPTTLTKYKVGDTYVDGYGSGSFSFGIDLSGYSGDAGDLDVYIYYLYDWDEFVATGNGGSDKIDVIASSPHRLDLVD